MKREDYEYSANEVKHINDMIKYQKEQAYKEGLKESKGSKTRFKTHKLINIIKIKPKNLFKRNRATIVLPKNKVKPILRKSEIFENEYEKEKNLLGWK